MMQDGHVYSDRRILTVSPLFIIKISNRNILIGFTQSFGFGYRAKQLEGIAYNYPSSILISFVIQLVIILIFTNILQVYDVPQYLFNLILIDIHLNIGISRVMWVQIMQYLKQITSNYIREMFAHTTLPGFELVYCCCFLTTEPLENTGEV